MLRSDRVGKAFLNALEISRTGRIYTTRTDLHVFTCKSYSAYQNILGHLNLWTVGLRKLYHANFLFEKCCCQEKKGEKRRKTRHRVITV